MNFKRYVFFTIILLLSLPVFAQDDDLTQFEGSNGLFAFSYPSGWVADGFFDVSEGTIMSIMTNDETVDLFVFDPTNVPQGNATIMLYLAEPNNLNDQLSADMPLDELAQLLGMMIQTDLETSTELTFSEPRVIELDSGKSVGRVDFDGGTGEGMTTIYPLGEYIVIGFVMAHQGEFSEYESQALQVIDSFTVDMDLLEEATSLPSIEEVLPMDSTIRNVIFDGDMAHEDYFALVYLLNHPHAKVLAVTVEGTGEAYCEAGIRNTLGVLMVAGKPDIRVACGREKPLVGDHVFPLAWREEIDRFYGVSLPPVTSDSDRTASSLINLAVGASTTPVTIVAVGPLTNIAEAIQEHPNIVPQIEAIYIMGGAVNVPGNVGPSTPDIDNDLAEWNIYIDPVAANIVLQSGIPITLVPLDATQAVPVSMSFVNRLGDVKVSATANLMHELLLASRGFVESGGFQFWDSVTAAIMTDNSLATFETYKIHVIEEEGPASGHTEKDENGVEIRVAVDVDRTRFENLLITVMNQ